MGLQRDLERYRKAGEEEREDLSDFITHDDLGRSRPDNIRVPIKNIDLPEFQYQQRQMGGVGQGDAEPGDPVDVPVEPDPDDEGGDDAGEGSGEHDYYEMDPEEFAEKLDDELGLDLEPKGKEIVNEREGRFTEVSRTGPQSLLDVDDWFKQGLKRKLASLFDENYVREAMKVDGMGPHYTYEWARRQNPPIPVSLTWIQTEYKKLAVGERDSWESIEEMEANVDRKSPRQIIREKGIRDIPLRREDRQYRDSEIIREYEHNVVVVYIRDVSGSMGAEKRELVERVFTPLDWYLRGKYDNMETVYIAHDSEAWETEREEFFGIRSGGGTRISSAYEVAKETLESEYPWSQWNRYVFSSGDGENPSSDTDNRVIPLMEEIDANLHAYLQVKSTGGHGNRVDRHRDKNDIENWDVEMVKDTDDVVDAIYEILSTEDND